MPLKRALQQLVDHVPEALGAILVDWEGEAVEQVSCMDEFELKVIGAHKGVILCNMREIVARLGSDNLEEILVATAQTQTLMLPVTSDYFLIFTFAKGEHLGLALFESRRCVQQLREEIV
ncbi:MAG: GTPase-activating protein [Desulfuromonadales bacterium GWD2_61_12]|nr:MAG: GTPase-activating protein [Desulfuromonadales bacterium GWC2_61_20]OGR36347.1 MAG: GTPase-activating protein [Desulfuromonadales bacterium GWD2_61_12]HAD05202.1 GTPase-activating protein [Desulfuromonas sp.]HBT83477.1 GTPase-activating protein [Desulfuromonas sp.]